MVAAVRDRSERATAIRKRSYDRILTNFQISGTPGGIRTPNQLLRTQLLYPLSYWGKRPDQGDFNIYRVN